MKFGKKKLPDPDIGSEKKSTGKKKKKKPEVKLQSPYFYLVLIAFLAAAIVAATLYIYQTFLTVPYKQQLRDEVVSSQLQALNSVFSEKLTGLQNRVAHYVEGIPGQSFTGSTPGRELQAKLVLQAMPASVRALVAPKGRASRDKKAPLPVSFASLDLIRSVEDSRQPGLEAFAVEGKWYVQVAAPKLDADKKVLGTLLVMFDAAILQPDWSVMPAGDIQLLQRVGDERQPVIVQGRAADFKLTAQTRLPQWTVAFAPEARFQTAVNMSFVIAVAAAGGLLAAALVALVFMLFLRKAERDIRLVSMYTQAALQGESQTKPKIQLNLLQSMVVRISQILHEARRAGGIGSAAQKQKYKPIRSGSANPQETATTDHDTASSEPTDSDDLLTEPLFQGDSLDIDMLEEDDLLGIDDELGEDGVDVVDEIFRAYDIRGVYGETLTGPVMREIGKALGSEAQERGALSIGVGMDGRDSSPELAQNLIQGLVSTGMKVVDIGVVPTPVLYFAIEHLGLDGGAMITGSHNAPEYNGLKMVISGITLVQEDTSQLLARIRGKNYVASKGELSSAHVNDDYIERIVSDIAVASPLKVVVDAGNGVAGELAPLLLTELGCEVVPLHCELDSRFPNHHPDPSQPENLQDLIAKVKETEADIGIALDGDGDRIGVISNTGEIIWPDRLLMLFAKDVVSRNPGADVIFDVKSSRRLNGLISGFGGRPVMWRSGHSMMKAKMRETGALLGGEMTGHIFFKERWSGFDDGLYSAARLLEILGIDDRDAQTVFNEFPNDVSTPELHIMVSEEDKFAIMEQLEQHGQWDDATVSTIDGLRVDYTDGWGLCRASNTSPNLVLRFEAETEEGLQRIQEIFRTQLLALNTQLELPF